MKEKELLITTLLAESKTADDNEKGEAVYSAIMQEVKKDPEINIALNFDGIELVNTAFLNNAIGKLFDRNNFDLNKNKVRIINIKESMVELVKETIAVARERY